MEEMGDEMHAQLVKYQQVMESMEMGREYLRHLGVLKKQILIDMWKLCGRNASAVARIVGVSHTPIYEAIRDEAPHLSKPRKPRKQVSHRRKPHKLNVEGG